MKKKEETFNIELPTSNKQESIACSTLNVER